MKESKRIHYIGQDSFYWSTLKKVFNKTSPNMRFSFLNFYKEEINENTFTCSGILHGLDESQKQELRKNINKTFPKPNFEHRALEKKKFERKKIENLEKEKEKGGEAA